MSIRTKGIIQEEIDALIKRKSQLELKETLDEMQQDHLNRIPEIIEKKRKEIENYEDKSN